MKKISKNIYPTYLIFLLIKFIILSFNKTSKIIVQIFFINISNSKIRKLLLLIFYIFIFFIFHYCPIIIPLNILNIHFCNDNGLIFPFFQNQNQKLLFPCVELCLQVYLKILLIIFWNHDTFFTKILLVLVLVTLKIF